MTVHQCIGRKLTVHQCNHYFSMMDDGDDVVSFEDAVREGEKRVLFTGPRR